MSDLPVDLHAAVDTLVERANVCRLITVADLAEALPDRPLSRAEIEQLFSELAHQGLHVIEPDAAERPTKNP